MGERYVVHVLEFVGDGGRDEMSVLRGHGVILPSDGAGRATGL